LFVDAEFPDRIHRAAPNWNAPAMLALVHIDGTMLPNGGLSSGSPRGPVLHFRARSAAKTFVSRRSLSPSGVRLRCLKG
jgi:hypothetical protein